MVVRPRDATDDELTLVHDPKHVKKVDGRFAELSAAGSAGSGPLTDPDDKDMFWSNGTAAAARLAAGCVVEAALCAGPPHHTHHRFLSRC